MSKNLALWDLHLSAWIVQDGNYPDFSVGQVAEFAIEFWHNDKIAVCEESTESISYMPTDDFEVDVVSKIEFSNSEITVLNFGILAFTENLPPEILPYSSGKFKTRLGLGIDPFFYFERLSKVAGVPPLIYSWRINSIFQQTAPFIETVEKSGFLAGRKVFVRDQLKTRWKEISKTDAWNDDNGRGSYVLRCELLPIEPKFISATAT